MVKGWLRRASGEHHAQGWLSLAVIGLLIALFTAVGPAEKSLGVNVRVVYLHGAWVWTALAGFVAAGLVGMLALLTRRSWLYRWSQALGRAGLLFWVTYLPISLWAMQTNWNGLFLAEPRWRLAAIFAVTGVLLQAGLALWNRPAAYALGNTVFVILLIGALLTTQDVLHPQSPILQSDSLVIKAYFISLYLLTLAAGFQVAWLWRKAESAAG
jgi:hypothetical protein